MQSINFWPILVASLASFGVSSLWYSPILFGKEWISLVKMTDGDMADIKFRGVTKLYITQFVATLVTFAVVAFAMSEMNVISASDGAFLGFLAWLGFIVPMRISPVLWRKEPMKLFLIDVINYLIVLVIGSAIIGAWV